MKFSTEDCAAAVMSEQAKKYADLFYEKALIAEAKTIDELRYSSKERVEAAAELELLTEYLRITAEISERCVKQILDIE